MSNTIEVQWLATVTGALQAIDKLNSRLDKQEKALVKISETSVKGNNAAVGSYQRLEMELRKNEARLKQLAIGSQDFTDQKKKVEELRGEYEQAKQALASLSDEQANIKPSPAFGTMAKSFGIATAAAWAFHRALKAVGDAQDETVQGAAETIVNVDTLARRLQIQAGLTDPQRAEQTRSILEQSSVAGVTAETGFRTATQLAGSGFADAVNTGTLKTVLDTIQASSFQGSPEDLVSAFTEALNAYGLDKTNENLNQIGIAAQGLFKQTDFQLTELKDFAKNAAVFESAGLDIRKAMAAFTTLREVLPAEQAGTGFRNFVSILQTAAGEKEKKTALKDIGLKPDQVDLVGENLQQVLGVLRESIAKMPEEKANVALGRLFGRENIASAQLLIARQERIAELEKLQADDQQFIRDRDVAAAGMQAARNRIANEELLQQIPRAEALNQLDLERLQRGSFFKDIKEKSAATGIPLVGAAGTAAAFVAEPVDSATGTKAVRTTTEGLSDIFSSFFRTQEDIQRQQLEEQRRQTQLLQQQADEKNKSKPASPQATKPREAPLPAVTTP